MATSGLVVMAMHAQSQRDLNKQFELRQTQKRYFALLEGAVAADCGAVDLPLFCDWPNRPKQKVCFEHGKPSLTHYQVLQRSAHSSRLKLTPITGRSHQLRVHMQWLQHPILGDKFYGNPQGRLQLHAEKLVLTHPESGERLHFLTESPF